MNRDVWNIAPTQSYNISVSSLFQEANNNIEAAENILIARARQGTIWFPYQKYFRVSPEELFVGLKTIDLQIEHRTFRLYSYYPQYNSYMPPKFRQSPTVIAGSRETYDKADALSDYFIENIRLSSKRYDQENSILDCWNIDPCLRKIFTTAIKTQQFINPRTLRQSIYETIAETKVFNPTWAKALLKLVLGPNLAGKKWLDISAGWGDRLITAMSLNMDYVGYDPNTELKPGHTQMISKFGNPDRQRVIYEPFETANIPDGPYDVVLSSPPYFTVEEYAPNQPGQSIVSYSDFRTWMISFLFTALNKAWSNLKEDGYLILHLGDTKTINMSEATNIYIENFLPGASWEGLIGLQGEAGFARPVWVWKKLSVNEARSVWHPENTTQLQFTQRTLYNTYPDLNSELIRSFASKYSSSYLIRLKNVNIIRSRLSSSTNIDDLLISTLLENYDVNYVVNVINQISKSNDVEILDLMNQIAPFYGIRKTNADTIRQYISNNFSETLSSKISDILNDDLMISSLLEILTPDDMIKWGTGIVKLSLRV